MSTSKLSGGLRQRKKAQTRLAIRREAFRLFDERGFADTTVEQIAAAADISPRTFYRYFNAKEAVLICDQSGPIVDAMLKAPRDLSPVAAYRHAVNAYFGSLTDEEREDAIIGQHMLYSVPEARGLLYSEYVHMIDLMADALVVRPKAPSDAAECRVIAGAIVGVLMAASDNTPLPEDALARSLDILAEKLHR
ncbi:transcriptional regulator [Mycolicibacterium chubuense NBB4]|uniref:Transcriptional regulator n=1 Tax=Mycolicibacterium chubuense (strain NBB4) TaxID=710421 RepID=I4BK86_MYCCN|nr:TetR family transcriptional regulator [Mycolicibacterium chubuense]AFM17693.1 transcriptional regulator [Mycolicibacterium chubuense NBB4]